MARESRNTHPPAPDAARLQAAVDLVVARLRPDQIILFGSAAREDMTERSDLDLLVISNDTAGRAPDHRHWACPQTGDELDVILMDRATAEQGRRSAARVQGAALEEGRTLYARDGAEPLRTGPSYVWNGETMVKSTLYEPDHAGDFLEQAERKWRTANREEHAADKCEALQAAMERAFKALIVAQGRRVKHTHDLDALWEQAEGVGERIDAPRDRAGLGRLSRYAGDWQYAVPSGVDSDADWKSNKPTGEDLLAYARRRVPLLIRETRERLRRMAEET